MTNLRVFGRRVRWHAKRAFDAALGALFIVLLKAIRHVDRIWISDVFSRFTRAIGPRLREHKLGRANLTAAFPDKTPAEIEQTMRELEEEMLAAAEELRFEYAAKLRDEIRDLRRDLVLATAPAE